MIIHDFPWLSMIFHNFPWVFIDFSHPWSNWSISADNPALSICSIPNWWGCIYDVTDKLSKKKQHTMKIVHTLYWLSIAKKITVPWKYLLFLFTFSKYFDNDSDGVLFLYSVFSSCKTFSSLNTVVTFCFGLLLIWIRTEQRIIEG